MSGNNIIRLGVDNSNATITNRSIDFELVNALPFINNSGDYEVYIKKCEIPIGKDLALYKGRNPIYVTLEATDKNNKPAIFGDDLFRTFSIGDSFTKVADIVNGLNKKIYDQIEPAYQWCRFIASPGDKIDFEVVNHENASKMKVWIDVTLKDLLEELPLEGAQWIQGLEYFEMFSPKPVNQVYTQDVSKFKNFINLKKFRLYSDLPTEPYWLYDQTNGTMIQSRLLGDITFNSVEMLGNSNLIYLANPYSYCSLVASGPISRFKLNIMAYYGNGLEAYCTLDRGSYTNIELVFERKFKN